MEEIRRKIIYVDDVNHSLLSLKDRLKNWYEVYPAQTVAKMFDILTRVSPDVILMDVNMPDVDGYEAIQRLKKDIRYANIPVIFLTSQSDRDSIFKGMNLGAAAYVNKPFTAAALMEQIEGVFRPDRKQASRFAELLGDDDDASKPCILAVDDVSVMLRTIQSTLRDLYRVFVLTNPDEITSILKSIKPDLFLLDYNMPGMNGFDLIPIIRNHPDHLRTPIIFITADGTTDRMMTASTLGACDFIVKPINVQVLREKVAKHIAQERRY
jgi:DNA-binding response OmpR family regulator